MLARNSPLNKYKRATKMAEVRGIEMRLTFDQWLQIWIDSGHWEERGCRQGQYCMSRFWDRGHYEEGNVFIQLTSQNSSDAHRGKSLSTGHKERLSRTGHKHSTKTKAKMRLSALGRKHSDETKAKLSLIAQNRGL